MVKNNTVMSITQKLLDMDFKALKKLTTTSLRKMVTDTKKKEADILKGSVPLFNHIFNAVALQGVENDIIKNLHSLISNAICPVIENNLKERLKELVKDHVPSKRKREVDEEEELPQPVERLNFEGLSTHVMNRIVHLITIFALGRKWKKKKKTDSFPTIKEFIINYQSGNKRKFTQEDRAQLEILGSCDALALRNKFMPPEVKSILGTDFDSGYRSIFKTKRDEILGQAMSLVKAEASSMKRHFFPGPTTKSSMVTMNRQLFTHVLLDFLDSRKPAESQKIKAALNERVTALGFQNFNWNGNISSFNKKGRGDQLTRVCFPKFNEKVYGKAPKILHFSGCIFTNGVSVKWIFFHSKKPTSWKLGSKAVNQHGCKPIGYSYGNLLRVSMIHYLIIADRLIIVIVLYHCRGKGRGD